MKNNIDIILDGSLTTVKITHVSEFYFYFETPKIKHKGVCKYAIRCMYKTEFIKSILPGYQIPIIYIRSINSNKSYNYSYETENAYIVIDIEKNKVTFRNKELYYLDTLKNNLSLLDNI